MLTKCSKYFIPEGEFPEIVQASLRVTGNFIGKDNDLLLYFPPFPFLFSLKSDMTYLLWFWCSTWGGGTAVDQDVV